ACILTNLAMLGMLGLFDWRMTVISSNFVALLLIITLAIAVHLVVRYRELEAEQPDADARSLALQTVAFMLRPCLYTSLTTVIAFMSLVISGIRPIIDFGWMMTVGVLVALALTFLVVPVGMVLGAGKVKSPGSPARRTTDQAVFTRKFATVTEKFGNTVLLVALLIAVFAVTGLFRLKVENRFIDYFDENTEIYRGMELIDSKLGGTIPLDIILFPGARDAGVTGDAGAGYFDESIEDDAFSDDEFAGDDFAEDSFASGDDDFDSFDDDFAGSGVAEKNDTQSQWFTRSGLQRVLIIHEHLDQLEETGKVLSLGTVYKLATDLLGGSVDDIQLTFAYRGLPEQIKTTMIDPYLNAEADETRINVRVKETSRTLNRADLLENLHVYMQDELGYAPEDYRFTGMLVLYNNMLQSLFTSQILTLGVVFIAIMIMLAILFRSIWLAFIGIIPNILAALLVLGGMGWAGLPLDMMTITIAAISIGIGVDNTIHYVHRFKREFPASRNYVQTMYRCHGSIGRAMYYTSITIIFGFSILALSNFKPSIYFGLLTGVAMLSALLGSLLLLPRLLVLLKPLGPEQELEHIADRRAC
ncbi:MAG: MMPL family transporter, partial [Pseudomonadales bacterium]